MSNALGVVLPLAVAIAVFPVPIIVVVLMVGSDRGRAKGLAFVIAWCVGLTAVGAVVLALAEGADARDDGEPATWVAVLLLTLGLLLFAAAVKQWQGRPTAGQEASLPGWMGAIDVFTIAKSGAAGFALSALNPKNVLLVIAAAVEIGAFGCRQPTRSQSCSCSSSSRRSVCSHHSYSPPPLAIGLRNRWTQCAAGWPSTTQRSWPCSSLSSGRS